MRKVLFSLLNGYKKVNLKLMQWRGITADDVAEQRVISGQAWEEFCDTLKASGAAITFPGTPKNAFDQAEGYRYLSRLTRAGLMAFIEHADPRSPVLHRVVNENVKMGADNPDNHYYTACISGEYEYVISGKRNTVKYLGFGTQIGHYGQGGGLPPSGYLEASQLEIDSNGYFEIHLSKNRKTRNWLPMTPDSGCLIVRQTFLDRENELPAELTITRIIDDQQDDDQPTPFGAKSLDDGLRSASTLVAGASLLFAKWARDFQRHSNELPLFDPEVSNAAGGDPNIRYFHSHWALKPDEALLIEVTPPECEHWNFQLNNYWMESLDYCHFRIHTNKHLAQYEADQSVRIVVAHTDPGLPNWISTAHHQSGTMCFRWIRATNHPQPRTRVVSMASLHALSHPQSTAAPTAITE